MKLKFQKIRKNPYHAKILKLCIYSEKELNLFQITLGRIQTENMYNCTYMYIKNYEKSYNNIQRHIVYFLKCLIPQEIIILFMKKRSSSCSWFFESDYESQNFWNLTGAILAIALREIQCVRKFLEILKVHFLFIFWL